MELSLTLYIDDYGKQACMLTTGGGASYWGKSDHFARSFAMALEALPKYVREDIADAA